MSHRALALNGQMKTNRKRTGSHPSAASNPRGSSPSSHRTELFPATTSVSALYPFLYSQGFKKPSCGRPAERSRSLRSATTLATVGLAALVPYAGKK